MVQRKLVSAMFLISLAMLVATCSTYSNQTQEILSATVAAISPRDSPTPIAAMMPTLIRPRTTKEPALSSFAEVPVPSIAVTPESTVNLTVTDITNTVLTRNQAAVVWEKNGVRHFGLLNFMEASIKQLKPSISADRLPVEITWSPDATTFTYRQDKLDLYGIPVYTDLYAVRTDNLGEMYTLLKGQPYFDGCEWEPNARSISCHYVTGHGEPCEAKTFDSTTWRQTYDGLSACPWDRKPQAVDDADMAASQFCQRLKDKYGTEYCPNRVSPDRRFVALTTPMPSIIQFELVVLDVKQRQMWRVGHMNNWQITFREWSWSADGRYLVWIEEDQIHVFDITSHAAIAYVVPNVKMLNIAWSPLQ